MNANAELLNFIYQNAQMGLKTLDQLLNMVQDQAFRQQLQSQYREYEEIHKAAKEMLHANGYDEKGISAFEKVRTYLMIEMQTLTDKSPSHIAEMLMTGSNMGIIQATRNLKKYQDAAEKDILGLMQRLLTFEENNYQALKAFL